MNGLLAKLKGGDLRSDGRADEVAERVLMNPSLIRTLGEGLDNPDDVVRARTAHALEKISRIDPALIKMLLPRLMECALNDKVPMVRWHIAMILGNVKKTEKTITTLFSLLKDTSDFVKSWAIASLAVIGKRNEEKREAVMKTMKPLRKDRSLAIRRRVAKALHALEKESRPLPKGWVKASRPFQNEENRMT